MRKRLLKLSGVIVPTSIILGVLIYFFYIKTDMGFSDTIMVGTHTEFPLWFDVIVVVLMITSLCAYKFYCWVYKIKE